MINCLFQRYFARRNNSLCVRVWPRRGWEAGVGEYKNVLATTGLLPQAQGLQVRESIIIRI